MRKAVLFAALLGLAGCMNPYTGSYRSTLTQWPGGEAARLETSAVPPKLVSSADMQADSLAMMENGYLLVGKSTFKDSTVDENLALQEAARIGAAVVMVGKEYVNTVTQSVPVNEWIPPSRVTYNERVDSPDGRIYTRKVTKIIEGEYQVRYVPQNVDYYSFSATYWAKSKPPIFGVLVQALDDTDKKAIQSNKGVIVKAVIKGSPAFESDILHDDIIVQINDTPVNDPDAFFDAVIANTGKPVTVRLLRNGTELAKDLAIRTEAQ